MFWFLLETIVIDNVFKKAKKKHYKHLFCKPFSSWCVIFTCKMSNTANWNPQLTNCCNIQHFVLECECVSTPLASSWRYNVWRASSTTLYVSGSWSYIFSLRHAFSVFLQHIRLMSSLLCSAPVTSHLQTDEQTCPPVKRGKKWVQKRKNKDDIRVLFFAGYKV